MKSHRSYADAVDELGRQRTADRVWRESTKHNQKKMETLSTDFNTVFLTQPPSSKSPNIDVGAHETQPSIPKKASRVRRYRCQKIRRFLIAVALVRTHVNADVQVADYLPGASAVTRTIDSRFNWKFLRIQCLKPFARPPNNASDPARAGRG